MKIGTNTYGLGAALREDLDATIASLKGSGITSIEPCILFQTGLSGAIMSYIKKKEPEKGGIFPSAVGELLIRRFRAEGFTVKAIHVMGVNWKRGNYGPVLRFCRENRIKYAVVSFMESSVGNIRELLPILRDAANRFGKAGISLLIHNHAQEWQPSEGTSVMQYLADNAPEIGFELDAGWTEYAGISSVEAMRRFRNRIKLLHLKEIQKNTTDLSRPFCVAPGTGILPLGEVMKEAAELPLDEDGILFDQDNSVCGDILADIREGVSSLKAALQQ